MNLASVARRQGALAEFARISRRRTRFVLIQVLHLVIFSAFLEEGELVTGVLALSGLVCIAVYLYLLKSEIFHDSQGLTPFQFYVSASVFRLGIGTMYVASLAANNHWRELQVGLFDVSDDLMFGHWIAMLGDLCFILGYFAVDSMRVRRCYSVKPTNDGSQRVYVTAVAFSIFCLALRLLESRVSFGGFGQLVSYLIDYGPSAAVYILLIRLRSSKASLLSPQAMGIWVLLMLNVAWAARSYMKTDLFIALLPVVLIALGAGMEKVRRRGIRAVFRPLVVLTVVLYFFLFVVSAYSQLRRPDFWVGHNQTKPIEAGEVQVTPYLKRALLSAVPGTEENEEIHRYPRSGAWALVSRMSMMMYPAWAYMQVERAGTREDSLFKAVLTAVTPRLLWPDKPQLSPGADYTAAIGLARDGSTAHSATAITMQAAYYWWGGFPYLVFGCFITGAGFAAAWRLFREQSFVNPISATVILVLYYNGFHWFESAFNGAIPFYLYLVIVFLPLQRAMRFWLVSSGRPQKKRERLEEVRAK